MFSTEQLITATDKEDFITLESLSISSSSSSMSYSCQHRLKNTGNTQRRPPAILKTTDPQLDSVTNDSPQGIRYLTGT